MRRSVWNRCVANLMGWLLTAIGTIAHASTDEPRLTIQAGFYTFSEIATLLSTPEAPVLLEPALKNRAAFLSVHQQPRSHLKEALTEALGVRFRYVPPRKDTKGYWLMEADPERKREERQWLRQLTEGVFQEARYQFELLQDFHEALFGELELVEVEQAMSSLTRTTLSQDPATPLPAEWYQTPFATRLKEWLRRTHGYPPPPYAKFGYYDIGLVAAYSAWAPWSLEEKEAAIAREFGRDWARYYVVSHWYLTRMLRKQPLSPALLRTMTERAFLSGEAVWKLGSIPELGIEAGYFHLHACIDFLNSSRSFDPDFWFYITLERNIYLDDRWLNVCDGWEWFYWSLPLVDLWFTCSSVERLLGEAFQERLAQARRQTEALLSEDWARLRVKPPDPDGVDYVVARKIDSFWTWLEAFAQQSSVSVVAELDMLQSGWPEEGWQGYATAYQKGTRWLVHKRSEILVFHNPFSFWWRNMGVPASACLELARQYRWSGGRGRSSEWAAPLSAWLNYVRRVSPSEQNRLNQVLSEAHGREPYPHAFIDIRHSYEVAWLLSRLPLSKRAAILSRGGECVLSDFVSVSPEDVELLFGRPVFPGTQPLYPLFRWKVGRSESHPELTSIDLEVLLPRNPTDESDNRLVELYFSSLCVSDRVGSQGTERAK